MNTIKKIGLSALLAATLLTSANAGSVGGFGGSLEVTQWGRFGAETVDRAMAYAKQLEEYALQAKQFQQQIDQYTNQFKSYEMMLKNIEMLPQAQWDQFTQSVIGLKQSLDFGQALAFTASSFLAICSKVMMRTWQGQQEKQHKRIHKIIKLSISSLILQPETQYKHP